MERLRGLHRMCRTWEPWLLAGLACALPVSIAVSNVLWGAALLCALGSKKMTPPYRWTGVEIPWAALLAAGVVSALVSEDPSRAFRSMRGEILAVVFLLAAHGGEPSRLWGRFSLFVAAASFAAVWGAAQAVVQAPAGLLAMHAGRSSGFYSHPITYAEVLLLAGPVALGLGLEGRFRWWGPAVVLIAGAVVLSQTRGVWLASAGVLGLWLMVRRDRKLLKIAVLAAVCGGTLMVVSPSLRQRAESMTATTEHVSNRIRLGLWGKAWETFQAHPVWGVGDGHFRVKGSDLRWGGSEPDKVWTETHNNFLQMMAERGIVGVGLYGWFLAALGRMMWKSSRVNPALQGLFFGYVGLVMAGMTESWNGDSEVVMSLYYLAGTAWRLSQNSTHEVT